MDKKRNLDTIAATGFPLKKTKCESIMEGQDRKMTILGKMLEYHMIGNDCVTYELLRIDLNIGKRAKSWGLGWKALREEGLVEACSNAEYKGYQMTQRGKEQAATDEYREYLKESSYVPMSNKEKHERIKKRLMWQIYGRRIFDLLLKHGALTIEELAAIVGVKRGAHKFSFAVKELKDKFYIENITNFPNDHCEKIHLSDACFLKPEDRPEAIVLSADELLRKVKINAESKGHFGSMRKASLPRPYKKTKTKVLLEETQQDPEKKGACFTCTRGGDSLEMRSLLGQAPVVATEEHPIDLVNTLDPWTEKRIKKKPRLVISLQGKTKRVERQTHMFSRPECQGDRGVSSAGITDDESEVMVI